MFKNASCVSSPSCGIFFLHTSIMDLPSLTCRLLPCENKCFIGSVSSLKWMKWISTCKHHFKLLKWFEGCTTRTECTINVLCFLQNIFQLTVVFAGPVPHSFSRAAVLVKHLFSPQERTADRWNYTHIEEKIPLDGEETQLSFKTTFGW